jgi:hexosaminidase
VANKDYEDFHGRALKAVDELRAKGYNPFDLKNEVGNRPGADKPVENLGMGKKVTYAEGTKYYSGYTAGGDDALVNGILGGWSYSDQLWQGFLKGIDVTIDLEKETPIKEVNADFMQICGPGVFMPNQVIVSVSNDGKEFTELAKVDHQVVKDDAVTFKTFGWTGEATARYVRYQASHDRNFGGFLFVDEIVIK